MDRPVTIITYEQIDLWIASLQDTLLTEGFASAIGILRGGAPLALMVSHAIGVPVAFIRYERATRKAVWDSSLPPPAPGSKVLLCEDISGRGYTMADCIALLQNLGLNVKTLTAAYDELSRIKPDYGINAVGYFASFPWERHAHTDAYRVDWLRTEAGRRGTLKEDHEYTTFAVDLDGILVPDVPAEQYITDLEVALNQRDQLAPFPVIPGIELKKARAIITARPEIDRVRTERWLSKHGFDGIPLVMRDATHYPEGGEGAVAHKIDAAIRLGCTHFIESDLTQAVLIAERAPLMRVVWWDAIKNAGKLISAQTWRNRQEGD